MRPGTEQPAFVIIVFGLSLAINMQPDALAFLYIDRSSLVMTLCAVVVTGLLVYRNLLFAVLVCGLVFATNQPPELLELLQVSGLVLRKTLYALMFAPIFIGLFGMNANASNTRPVAP